MSTKRTVAVIGSTGAVGTAVLTSLSRLDNVIVRAGTRDPATVAAKIGVDLPNVTFSEASATDIDSVVRLFEGVDAVFINVPGQENRADLAKNSVAAAARAKVPAIVVISAIAVTIRDIFLRRSFREVEDAVIATGIPYTFVRLPYFMENMHVLAKAVKFTGSFSGNIRPDAPFTSVAVGDVGDVIAKLLSDTDAHANKIYTLTSPPMAQNSIASILSRVVGVPVSYVCLSTEEELAKMRSFHLPEWICNGVVELNEVINLGDPCSINNTGDIEKVLGRPATTYEEWFTSRAAEFK